MKIDALHITKVGIRPEDLRPGRPAEIAYFMDCEGSSDSMLLIRRSAHIPLNQAECFDASKADPEGPKAAIQSYNHGPVDGAPYPHFGEIEIQLNPAKREESSWYARAVTELLAYRGHRERIVDLTGKMLSLEEPLFLY